VAEVLITPEQLRRFAEEKEMEKARQALKKKRKADSEHDQLRDAFMSREIHPEVFERFSRAGQAAEPVDRSGGRAGRRAGAGDERPGERQEAAGGQRPQCSGNNVGCGGSLRTLFPARLRARSGADHALPAARQGRIGFAARDSARAAERLSLKMARWFR
jgi:hypothetical protein